MQYKFFYIYILLTDIKCVKLKSNFSMTENIVRLYFEMEYMMLKSGVNKSYQLESKTIVCVC